MAGRAGKDALTAFANAYRDYARVHPGRYEAARYRLDPQTAAASAGVRHAQMTRAILRGYELAEPDQTHAVRMLGSVFHGYAFGESIFGAETSPLYAYLLGLILIQSALTVATALVARRRGGGVSELTPRLAGAAIIGVGLTVLIGQLIPGA